jgi:hypothetical protein
MGSGDINCTAAQSGRDSQVEGRGFGDIGMQFQNSTIDGSVTNINNKEGSGNTTNVINGNHNAIFNAGESSPDPAKPVAAAPVLAGSSPAHLTASLATPTSTPAPVTSGLAATKRTPPTAAPVLAGSSPAHPTASLAAPISTPAPVTSGLAATKTTPPTGSTNNQSFCGSLTSNGASGHGSGSGDINCTAAQSGRDSQVDGRGFGDIGMQFQNSTIKGSVTNVDNKDGSGNTTNVINGNHDQIINNNYQVTINM